MSFAGMRIALELDLVEAVHFTGPIDNLALPELFRCADLLLSTSTWA